MPASGVRNIYCGINLSCVSAFKRLQKNFNTNIVLGGRFNLFYASLLCGDFDPVRDLN